jgi:NAD(P)H-dependent FMN reductase
MEIFAFAASLREGSYNRQLLDLVVRRLEERDVECVTPHFSEFEVPLYDQDLQDAEGIAEGALRLAEHLERSDGYIIVSPEYNHGVPGVLKNLVDWASRIRPDQPFGGCTGMIMTASPSMVGGHRGASHLRDSLVALGTRLYPSVFSLARAHQAFAEDGTLSDEGLGERLVDTLESYLDFVRRLGDEA